MQTKKYQLDVDLEQWTDSKLGKEYNKAVHYHPPYLTYMQSTIMQNPRLNESKAGIKIVGEILTASNMQVIPF